MERIYAIIIAISSIITALTVIITAIKNGRKKIRQLEDSKQVVNELSEMVEFLKRLPEEVKIFDKKVDDLTNNLQAHIDQNQKQTELLVEVSRDLLFKEMKDSIANKWDTPENKTRIADLFGKYQENGGNHGLNLIYDEYKILPEQPPEE